MSSWPSVHIGTRRASQRYAVGTVGFTDRARRKLAAGAGAREGHSPRKSEFPFGRPSRGKGRLLTIFLQTHFDLGPVVFCPSRPTFPIRMLDPACCLSVLASQIRTHIYIPQIIQVMWLHCPRLRSNSSNTMSCSALDHRTRRIPTVQKLVFNCRKISKDVVEYSNVSSARLRQYMALSPELH